jgi:putative secretion ATPase (PEP-CTERM system associated)
MYEVFYNFKAEPFRLSPDHKFCYEHKSYAKARAYMAYAFKRAEGFVMITGRPGTGKTTLIGELVESLSKDRVCTANLVCTQLQADDLLKTVGFSFGIGSTGIDKAEMLQRLTVLMHRWHREGRRALLIVDEAQDLSSSAMEELRLLTNIQIGGQPLLQIFLVGQPELRDLILSPEMEQVHQRIVAASHIEGLGVEETEAYVLHRLSVVGWRGDPAIDRAMFPLIHKYSEGVPRRINLICSRLFLLGSVEQRHDIRAEDVRVVITELQAENLAAGTGISVEDFDQYHEPEWVPAPQVEPHMPAANRLHAVDSVQDPAVDLAQSEATAGAKKKDSPELTSSSYGIPQASSARTEAPTEYFEDEPEYDQYIEPAPFSDSATSKSEPLASAGGQGAIASRSLTSEAPAKSRRLAMLAFLLAVAVVLVLSTVYFTSRSSGSIAQEERIATAGVDDNAVLPSVVPAQENHVVVEAEEREAGNGLERSADQPVNSSILSPANDDVMSQENPAILHVSESPESSGYEDELNVTSVSSAERPDSPESYATESRPAPVQGTTISVNFSFDSDELDTESHVALDSAVVALRENPDSIAAITGFTDNQGDEEYNLVLSRKRADAVKQYLVNAGIGEERLLVEGRGALTRVAIENVTNEADALEPYRVVQIELSGEAESH